MLATALMVNVFSYSLEAVTVLKDALPTLGPRKAFFILIGGAVVLH